MQVSFQFLVEELFIGEEWVFELQINNLDNIREQFNWFKKGEILYWIIKKDGRLLLYLFLDVVGMWLLSVIFEIWKFYLDLL